MHRSRWGVSTSTSKWLAMVLSNILSSPFLILASLRLCLHPFLGATASSAMSTPNGSSKSRTPLASTTSSNRALNPPSTGPMLQRTTSSMVAWSNAPSPSLSFRSQRAASRSGQVPNACDRSTAFTFPNGRDDRGSAASWRTAARSTSASVEAVKESQESRSREAAARVVRSRRRRTHSSNGTSAVDRSESTSGGGTSSASGSGS
mmetsp:Transcript_26754/g.54745  ORF Transcript_26754/g.54745 Transcript_26754/m.54745 type:complete len:205 (+) Transcript_26754:350-964(+)